MFIKQKRVRKSEKFSPRYIKSSKHRREITIANYSTALVQAALGVALLIVSYQTFIIFHSKISGDLSILQRYALPLAFLLGGLFAVRASIRRFQRVRAESRDIAKFYREQPEE